MSESVQVTFQKVSFDAIIPTKGSTNAACLDLYAAAEGYIRFGSVTKISTGVKIKIPHGYMGHVVPRSGLAVKKGYVVMAGIIDSDYRGELVVVLTTSAEQRISKVEMGDRIAQLLIIPNPTVEAIEGTVEEDTERGTGGFGSTGN